MDIDRASDGEITSLKLDMELDTEKYLTVHGPAGGMDDYINTAQQQGILKRTGIVHIGGFFGGMRGAMCPLVSPGDIPACQKLAAVHGDKISVHRTSWAFGKLEEEKDLVYEVLVPVRVRELKTLRPFEVIYKAFAALPEETPKVMQARANTFFVVVSVLHKNLVESEVVTKLEQAGLATKHNGKYLQSPEKKAAWDKTQNEAALEMFGAIGVCDTYAKFVLPRAIQGYEVDTAKVEIKAKYNLKLMGRYPYAIEGLTEEQKEKLEGKTTEVTMITGVQHIRFGYIKDIVDASVVRKWTKEEKQEQEQEQGQEQEQQEQQQEAQPASPGPQNSIAAGEEDTESERNEEQRPQKKDKRKKPTKVKRTDNESSTPGKMSKPNTPPKDPVVPTDHQQGNSRKANNPQNDDIKAKDNDIRPKQH
eukprot:gene9877-427_t